METVDRLAEDLERVREFLDWKRAKWPVMDAYHEIRKTVTEMIGLMMAVEELEATAEVEGDGKSDWWYVCSECHTGLDNSDKYCRQCGRRILWK